MHRPLGLGFQPENEGAEGGRNRPRAVRRTLARGLSRSCFVNLEGHEPPTEHHPLGVFENSRGGEAARVTQNVALP